MHLGLQQHISGFSVPSVTDYLLSKERLGGVRAWRKLKKVIEEIIGEVLEKRINVLCCFEGPVRFVEINLF